VLLETSATVTDEILDFNDRLLGSFFAKAKRQFESTFQDAGRAINDKVRLYAKIGQALIEAKMSQLDPFLAIESIVPWERFTQTVAEAEQLAQSKDFDYLGFLGDSYPQLRRYLPTLLETFDFKATPAAQDVLDAVSALRRWNRDGHRNVPDNAPRAFVRRRWAPYVFGEHGIDRHYYELCTVSELRNTLRAGDVWVSGSRQFKDFEDYLMPASAFDALAKRQEFPVAVPANFESFWNERCQRLHRELEHVANLAERQELPDAEIRQVALKVTPLHSTIPAAAEALVAEAYSMLPQVRITDLLLEVDRWTNFTQHFTHLKSDERAKDASLLLTAILADAIKLGLRKMSCSLPGDLLCQTILACCVVYPR
jgi:Tn3 transposase DDE domain